MAARNELTGEQLKSLLSFLEGGDTTALSNGAVDRLYWLVAAVGHKLADIHEEDKKRIFSLERRLDRYKSKEQAAVEQGLFADTGLDSLDVALALLYCLQRLKTYKLTKNKLIYILCEMYASWLGSKKERLFVEHPVCTQWGPQLWRVYKRIDRVGALVPYEYYEKLASQNAAVAAFCKNAAQKYYDWKESDLKELFARSEPYRNALPAHNGGKWNKEISDSDLYLWKANKS